MTQQHPLSGLYRPEFEHDSCGIGFVAHLKGKPSHQIVQDAITMLVNMEHRGACGCEANTGDGAGVLLQVPDAFLREEMKEQGVTLPAAGEYGVGMLYLPQDQANRREARTIMEKAFKKVGLPILGYRVLPVDPKGADIGPSSFAAMPYMEQMFVGRPAGVTDGDAFERKMYVARNYAEHQVHDKVEGSFDQFYFASLSYKTITYKGMLTTWQVRPFYLDLQDERLVSAISVVHSRFSTNTFPKWRLAQPFRYIAHNGEINTVRGNVNWMSAREAILESSHFTPEELELLLPICSHKQSDSANLDNAIELMLHSGRSLPHVMMMLVPEAWQEHPDMDPVKRAFYEYHANLMEPWDGPASISFTDGKFVGATLDRNGLRPSRFLVTDDDILVMGSETGALQVDPAKVVRKGRLRPGRIFVADLEEGRIVSDKELKERICSQQPYGDWIKENSVYLDKLPEKTEAPAEEPDLLVQQQAHGYTTEDLKIVLAKFCEKGTEPLGSMGIDTPLPILSDQSQHLAHYFKQLFAQVTNPPIDPIREKLVMSLFTHVGRSRNILSETPEHAAKIQIRQPILSEVEFLKLKYIDPESSYQAATLDALFPAQESAGVLEGAIDALCEQAVQAVKGGANILILSNRNVTANLAPIPSLMACGAVHHALIRAGMRAQCGIILEAGDITETHHVATLIGYGAGAVYPFLAYQTIEELHEKGLIEGELSLVEAHHNFVYGMGYGLRKIFSKMGISTLQSYQGAQIFEALGLSTEVVDKCFNGTVSRIEGMTFDHLAKEALQKHKLAFPESPIPNPHLEVGGVYQWKRRGEYHLFNPQTIHLLQHATKMGDYQVYKKYAELINDQTQKAATLRGLLGFRKGKSISISEVEPAEKIYRRFATGAMSFGSISHEAHSTLAIAMNRLGAKSNSGEGGEDEIRFFPKANGDWERSAIKQVASGRFGVTSYYLTNAAEIQIKMAQGAKPGEGGQLPGHKVDEWIGRVRHSTPGVGLISPPPHHDIYSIEDLAQLIFDLKNANRAARINVKLVAEAGVGTVASGVAKAKADVILISGHDGGTGASPLSSIRHAGLPWELGVSEAHQTLVRNKLRSRVVLQADGQMKTGRDIAMAALLGAEEWGVATAALVVEGCIMMRKCHLNTCPVGVATQNPVLRKRFTGDADHVVNFFEFLVQDLREIMAELGFRTIDEMVGRADMLQKRPDITHWKHKNLDLSRVLYVEPRDAQTDIHNTESQDHGLENVLDWRMLEVAKPALEKREKISADLPIVNTDRSVGAILSNEISKKYRGEGLPGDTIHLKFHGSAGQSFGVFGAKGLTLEVEGDANDYFGKGLSGAKLILYPSKASKFVAEDQIVVGNVAFYGGTSGRAYIRGMAGERFCVRNSGVHAVVEGVGDHACEYMTGGVAIILGETGRNFAAGMSGGVAYVYDPNGEFPSKVNPEMVDLDPMEESDLVTLRRYVTSHLKHTESPVAKMILDNWETETKKFVKVMPRDYKAVLMKAKLHAQQPRERLDEKPKIEIHG